MQSGGESPVIPSVSDSDWDKPFTHQELEAIEAAFQSATSSSSPIKRRRRSPICSDEDDGAGFDRRKNIRRLPDSIAGGYCLKSESNSMQFPNSFSFARCRRNPLRSLYHSSSKVSAKTAKLTMRYPTLNFGGQILYSRTVAEVDKAAKELLKFVEFKKSEVGRAVLGFDIEWRPTFRRGVSPGKAAVLQICGNKNFCYVMHIIHSGVPQSLQSLLEDPSSVKVGVGIGNDAVKFFKDHNVSVKDLEDLSALANQKLVGDPKQWGLGSLTEMVICKQIQKPNRIRLGNWEANVLSQQQLQYAATDAFASWFLYEALKSLPDAAVSKSEEPLEATPQ
ncbi:3'-5' exonuclease isoform X1 [Cornus florida]|uniref:3'-5' exonuclease isoform X1 n=1 Tax=Cornus florida TaxID=4283 RepID=UPI00289C7D22|nr:3'-5' exonuclease isoform X1 [Cornus florida]